MQVATVLGGVTSGDVDGDTLGLAVFNTDGLGTWQYSTDSTNGNNGTWTAFGVVNPNAALLLDETSWVRYVPDGASTETATFDFRAWDQSADSASTTGTPAYGDTVSPCRERGLRHRVRPMSR